MKTLKFFFFVAVLCVTFTRCTDDRLLSDLNTLENRVENMEVTVARLNNNLVALQELSKSNRTIRSWSKSDDGIYTLILSDDTEVVLSQGEAGDVNVPKIEIGKDGTWVIEGTDTGVRASGNTPEFRISNDGYWEVCTDGSGKYAFVRDEYGNKVYAKADEGEAKAAVFSNVEVRDGNLVITMAKTGKVYTFPIVSDLTAKITKEGEDYADGFYFVTWGATLEVPVNIEGETFFVTAPEGWKATVSVPDAEGNATLSVTAPAEPVSTKAADSSSDVVLSVNKGMHWAVDKIIVKGTVAANTMLEKYLSGRNLIINGVEINKSKFPKYQHVEEDTVIPKDYTGVYFVEGGVSLAFEKTNSAGADYVIVIGNSGDRTANFSLTHTADGGDKYFYCNKNNNTDKIGNFVFHNVIFTMANSSMYLNQSDATYSFVFDKCKVNQKKIVDLWNANGRHVNLFSVTDCVVTPVVANEIIGGDGAAKLDNLVFRNNVFYTASNVISTPMFNSKNVAVRNIILQNNTFYNVVPKDNDGMLKMSKVTESYTCTNNIFYQSVEVSGNKVIFYPADFETLDSSLAGEIKNNIGWRISGAGTWQDVWSGAKPVSSITPMDNLVGKEQDPFEIADAKNGIFVPKEDYKDYGAKVK